MKKMDFFGVGPKIGRVLIPWIALSIVVSCVSDRFKFTEEPRGIVLSGIILLIFGVIFYACSLRLLFRGIKEGKLVTNGTYYLCQNPLYISFVLFFIPATALLLNSWLVLTGSLLAFILVKAYVNREYKVLEEAFGDEYRKYRAETPEFFPFPVKKWFGRKG
jgi:protein-S-isoprenylcysteine O-methyltransferase Ste14